MANKTTIANNALVHAGILGTMIANLDTDGSANALAIRTVYETSRDEVLSDFRWPFAKGYTTPGLVSDLEEAYTPDYFYAYRYPSDCLEVRRIVPDTGRRETEPIPFAISSDDQGRLIHCDLNPILIEYTQRITKESYFDALFAGALSWNIAWKIAPALSRVANISQVCQQNYEVWISRAQRRAMMEAQQDPPPDAELIRARA